MLPSYEEVAYIEISDSENENEEAEGTQCQFPSCDFKVPPMRKNAIAAMEFHVMDRHSERRKALAIARAFPPHSHKASAMCRICKAKGKSVILKFVNRERHVITRHTNLFDRKWTRKWTDCAFENENTLDRENENETDAKLSNYWEFCLSNGESEVQYKIHTMKSTDGLVTCPVLRRYKCNICNATGDTADNKDGNYNRLGAGTIKKPIRPLPGRLNFETNVEPLKREVAKLRAENKKLTNMLNYVKTKLTKLREKNQAENRPTTRSRDTSISSVSSLDQRSRDSIGNILQRSELGPRISSRLSMSRCETELSRAGEVKTAASRNEKLKHTTEIQDPWEANHRSIQEAGQQQSQSFIPKPPPLLSREDLDSSVEILEEHENIDELLKSDEEMDHDHNQEDVITID